MDVKPIKTKKANTPEGDRLDVVTTLVEAYERVHFLMDLPDAVGHLKTRHRRVSPSLIHPSPLASRTALSSRGAPAAYVRNSRCCLS
jgi:antitoxin component HigA of HigAB toxin-antitoxin module